MDRSYFLKALIGLPFGGSLAKKLQSKNGEPKYLLNKFYVAGFQYYKGPSVIEEIEKGDILRLKADPENEYDRFAVSIYHNEKMLGHVPRTDNKHISRLMRQDVSLTCKIAEVNPQNDTWKMLKVHIYL